MAAARLRDTARAQDPAIDKPRDLGIPYVLINRRRDQADDWWISSDGYRGAFLLARRLAALGRRRVALLSGPADVSTAILRQAGLRAGQAGAGLHPPLTTIHVPLHDMGRRAAELLIGRVRKEVPDQTQITLPVALVERASVAPPAGSRPG